MAMIALLPAAEQADVIAVDGGEPVEQLHLTLFAVPPATVDLSPEQRSLFLQVGKGLADRYGPVVGEAFAVDVFNPDSGRSCIVLGLSGEALDDIHDSLSLLLDDSVYPQHKPWVPHITLRYTNEMNVDDQFAAAASYADRLGLIMFDRIRVALDDVTVDLPLSGDTLLPQPLMAAVNANGWSKLPIADRDTTFEFRAATDRLAAKAQSVAQFSSWFFWRDPRGPANNRNSYRLPFADVGEDGTVKLIPAAVFSAAAQLSGAHGVTTIPPAEENQIRDVITRIYDTFREMWNDPRQVPPWNRAPQKSAADEPVKDETAAIGGEEDMEVTVHIDEAKGLVEIVEEIRAAAVAPVKPPAEWFEDPKLQHPTRLRFDENGRVYGHIAQFGTCHRGYTDRCVTPPRSGGDYAQFKTGTVLTAAGELRRVGKISMKTGHAAHGLTAADAIAHYDNSGTGAAIVNVGEDAHGIWAAGAVLPDVTEETLTALRASPVSGDWRPVRGADGRVGLELINILAVNTPGFPIAEPSYSLTASGEIESLIAGLATEDCGCNAATLDVEKTMLDDRAQTLLARAEQQRKAVDDNRAAAIIKAKLS